MKKDIATPGADGAKVESLLYRVRTKGSEAIYDLAKDIAHETISQRNLVAHPKHIVKLAEEISKATATAHMLGRAKIRNRFNRFTSFSEASDFSFFSEGDVHPMSPRLALHYWQKLIPMRQVDPGAFEAAQEGQAFNIAATTNQNILKRIWDIIARGLSQGKVKGSPKEIDSIVREAGVEPRKGYGDMVFRTNTMEAYRHGAWEEYQDPAIADLFPVWQYLGIVDGRQRDRHHHLSINPVQGIRGGLFFPRDASFFDVRGRDAEDVCNCRCDHIPISAREWDRLQKQGARLSSLDEVRRAA